MISHEPRREGSGIGDELWLLFELNEERYAISLAAVAGVAEPGPLRAVPGAPPGVLGLVPWRGMLLTVLDLPTILGQPASAGRACLIHLSPPLGGTSLWLRALVRVGWAPTPGAGRQTLRSSEGTIECEGRAYRAVDPSRLLEAACHAWGD